MGQGAGRYETNKFEFWLSMMKIETHHLWLLIFVSFSLLSTCASQASLIGIGGSASSKTSRDISSSSVTTTKQTSVISDAPILTPTFVTSTNIKPSRVLKTTFDSASSSGAKGVAKFVLHSIESYHESLSFIDLNQLFSSSDELTSSVISVSNVLRRLGTAHSLTETRVHFNASTVSVVHVHVHASKSKKIISTSPIANTILGADSSAAVVSSTTNDISSSVSHSRAKRSTSRKKFNPADYNIVDVEVNATSGSGTHQHHHHHHHTKHSSLSTSTTTSSHSTKSSSVSDTISSSSSIQSLASSSTTDSSISSVISTFATADSSLILNSISSLPSTQSLASFLTTDSSISSVTSPFATADSSSILNSISSSPSTQSIASFLTTDSSISSATSTFATADSSSILNSETVETMRTTSGSSSSSTHTHHHHHHTKHSSSSTSTTTSSHSTKSSSLSDTISSSSSTQSLGSFSTIDSSISSWKSKESKKSSRTKFNPSDYSIHDITIFETETPIIRSSSSFSDMTLSTASLSPTSHLESQVQNTSRSIDSPFSTPTTTIQNDTSSKVSNATSSSVLGSISSSMESRNLSQSVSSVLDNETQTMMNSSSPTQSITDNTGSIIVIHPSDSASNTLSATFSTIGLGNSSMSYVNVTNSSMVDTNETSTYLTASLQPTPTVPYTTGIVLSSMSSSLNVSDVNLNINESVIPDTTTSNLSSTTQIIFSSSGTLSSVVMNISETSTNMTSLNLTETTISNNMSITPSLYLSSTPMLSSVISNVSKMSNTTYLNLTKSSNILSFSTPFNSTVSAFTNKSTGFNFTGRSSISISSMPSTEALLSSKVESSISKLMSSEVTSKLSSAYTANSSASFSTESIVKNTTFPGSVTSTSLVSSFNSSMGTGTISPTPSGISSSIYPSGNFTSRNMTAIVNNTSLHLSSTEGLASSINISLTNTYLTSGSGALETSAIGSFTTSVYVDSVLSSNSSVLLPSSNVPSILNDTISTVGGLPTATIRTTFPTTLDTTRSNSNNGGILSPGLTLITSRPVVTLPSSTATLTTSLGTSKSPSTVPSTASSTSSQTESTTALVTNVTETSSISVTIVTPTIPTPVTNVTETSSFTVTTASPTTSTPVTNLTETSSASVMIVTSTTPTPVTNVTETSSASVTVVTSTTPTPVTNITETSSASETKVTETSSTAATNATSKVTVSLTSTQVSSSSSVITSSSAPVQSSSAPAPSSSAPAPSTSTPKPSASTPVTSAPPQSTTANATTESENNWVKTVLKIPKNIDVATNAFKKQMEGGLVKVCTEAIKRKREGEIGISRKRRKRYTKVGDVAVHIHDMNREEDTTTVTAAYVVLKAGAVLEPVEVIDALSTLDTQELAIMLGHVVISGAEPNRPDMNIKVAAFTVSKKSINSRKRLERVNSLISSEAPLVEPSEESKLWIIAAVAGPILLILVIIWIVLCIYIKCFRTTKEPLEENSPQLTNLTRTTTKKEKDEEKEGQENQGYSNYPYEGMKPPKRKGSSYVIHPFPDAVFIRESRGVENTHLTSPAKKHNIAGAHVREIVESIEETNEIQAEVTPLPQRRKNSKKKSIDSNAPFSTIPAAPPPPPLSHQSRLSQDDEELTQRTETERSKNKERLREKQLKKSLETQKDGLPDVMVEDRIQVLLFVDRIHPNKPRVKAKRQHSKSGKCKLRSGSPNHAKISRQDSGVSNDPISGEETLEEARKKMHQLLDDAFTLISPSDTYNENDISHSSKVSPMPSPIGSRKSRSNSKSKISTVHLDSTKDLGESIKHEPMYLNTGSYKDFPLETWSPYRASDQVALISMPNTKVDTKLGGPKSKTKDLDRPATSKPSRRPAANFDIQESKSTSHLDDKLTNAPAKPIVLRGKDLAGLVNVNADKQIKDVTKSGKNSNGKYAMTSINGDVYLTGSTTNLDKPKKDDAKNDTIEMREQALWAYTRDKDEIDVINKMKGKKNEEHSEDLIRSLRDELHDLKGTYVDPKKQNKAGVHSAQM